VLSEVNLEGPFKRKTLKTSRIRPIWESTCF
jgi:hypothetical protein